MQRIQATPRDHGSCRHDSIVVSVWGRSVAPFRAMATPSGVPQLRSLLHMPMQPCSTCIPDMLVPLTHAVRSPQQSVRVQASLTFAVIFLRSLSGLPLPSKTLPLIILTARGPSPKQQQHPLQQASALLRQQQKAQHHAIAATTTKLVR